MLEEHYLDGTLFLATSVKCMKPSVISKYHGLGPPRIFKKKREFDQIGPHSSFQEDFSLITIADTVLSGTCESSLIECDDFEGFANEISVEVIPKVRNGMLAVYSRTRGQLKQQLLLNFELEDPTALDVIASHCRVLSNNNAYFDRFFKYPHRPILSVKLNSGQFSVTLKYTIQVLETLYMDYPIDVAGCISQIMDHSIMGAKCSKEEVNSKLFYDCITEKTQNYPQCLKPPLVPELDTDLLRFQGTTIEWMLSRENVIFNNSTKSVSDIPFWTEKCAFLDDKFILEKLDKLSFGFSLVQTPLQTEKIWYNKYSSNICSKESALRYLSEEQTPKGRGLLAEEMGLGKTVEIIALILLNQRPHNQLLETVHDDARDRDIRKAKTTLIVCPESILSQWSDEIAIHAPSISVMIYQGSVQHRKKSPSEVATEMAQHDVVLTTYTVMSREVHSALYNPSRSKRVRRAVTTKRDLRKDIHDPGIYDQAALDALEEIYEDMNLLNDTLDNRPDYTSPLVLLEFWRMVLDEAQMVKKSLSNVCTTATLIPRYHSWGASGTPIKNIVDDLNSLLTFMRLHPLGSHNSWKLLKQNPDDFKHLFSTISLRHTKSMVKDDIKIPPQTRILLSVPFGPIEQDNYDSMYKQLLTDVGLDEMGNPVIDGWEPTPAYYETMRSWLTTLRRLCCHPSFGRESGSIGTRNFQTMDRVLDKMIEEAHEKFREIDRRSITAKLEIGQIYEFVRRPRDALVVWTESCKEIESKLQKAESSRNDLSVQYLRGLLELLHRAYFFIASAHYQIYTPPLTTLVPNIVEALAEEEGIDPHLITFDHINSADITVWRVLTEDESKHQELERQFYSMAQNLRKRILAEPMEQVRQGIENLPHDVQAPMFTISHRVFKDLEVQVFTLELKNVILSLNEQNVVLNRWLSQVTDILRTPLLDSISDPSGEEYAASLNDQEYVSILLTYIQKVIKNREQLVTGKTSGEIYQQINVGNSSGDSFAEEIDKEYPKVFAKESLRGLLVRSRSLVAKDNPTEEIRPFTDVVIKLKNAFEEQKDFCDAISKHFRVLNDLYNIKINYFRRLQELSDSVRPFDQKRHYHYDPDVKIEELYNVIDTTVNESKTVESRIRYLNSLKQDATVDDSSKMCVICRSAINIGSLTACGHQYCKDCLSEWLRKKSVCPVCKVKIKQSDVYTFTFNKPEVNVKLATSQPSGEMFQIYHQLDHESLQKLNEIKLKYNHGSKVNIIVRQVLWLKRRDPKVQIVIYSQWTQLLSIIGNSLRFNGVEFLSSFNALDRHGSGGKTPFRKDVALFKKDPNITCFLLNSNADASGLNLVNATHVFLCEPLVQTALELQAISRVHRIGQTKPTTVWMFTISGTVEESIVLLSTRKRLEFKEQFEEEEMAKNVSSLVRTNGEFVEASDLWNSFFSHKVGRLI